MASRCGLAQCTEMTQCANQDAWKKILFNTAWIVVSFPKKNGRISTVNLVGIFATEKEQKITVSEFIQRKTIRKSLIEEN